MMKSKFFARRRVLYALAIGAFLTLALVSQGAEPTFSTKPWDNGKTPIPADFQGVDLERLVESLTPKVAPKDEFESTSEYQARMKKALDDLTANGLYGDLKRDSRIPVAGNGSTDSAYGKRLSIVVNSTYDADNKRIGVNVIFPGIAWPRGNGALEVPIETRGGTDYKLRFTAPDNRTYSAQVLFEKTSFYLADVEVEKARALKDQLGAVVVFTPKRAPFNDSVIDAYSFVEKKKQSSRIGSYAKDNEKNVFLNADDAEFWLYDKSTGETLVVLPLDWVAFKLNGLPRYLNNKYHKVIDDALECPLIPLGLKILAQEGSIVDFDEPTQGKTNSRASKVDDANDDFREATQENPSSQTPVTISNVNLDKWRHFYEESKENVQGWETRKATATLRNGENLSDYLQEYANSGTKGVSIPDKSIISVRRDRNDPLWFKYGLDIHTLPDGVVFQGSGEGENMTTIAFDFDDYLCLSKGRRVYFKNIRFVTTTKTERSNSMFVIFGFATFKDCEFVGHKSDLTDFVFIVEGAAEFTRCRFRNISDCGISVCYGRMKASLCEFDGSLGQAASSQSSLSSSESKVKKRSSNGVFSVDAGRIELDKCYFHNCSTAVAGKPRRKTVIRDSFFAGNRLHYWGTNAVLIQNLMWDDAEKDWKPLRLDPKALPK